MAVMPESMRLTEKEENELEAIRKQARIRHEKSRRTARKNGREDFPLFPYESSWAFEQQFMNRR